MENIKLDEKNFTSVNTSVSCSSLNGHKAIRIIKNNKVNQFDENTYAKINGVSFHNGIIEVKLISSLLPDAPEFARGFVGIVFRANENDSEFESFYLRPANGRSCTDPVRKKRGCQYFSYPGYTFQYFRDFHIDQYEAEADIDLNEEITIKAIIRGMRAEFFVNQAKVPNLIVNDLKHGSGKKGSVGIFVDIGTEAFVTDIKIICED